MIGRTVALSLALAIASPALAATASVVACPSARCADGPALDVRVPPSTASSVVVLVAIAPIGPAGPVWVSAGYATADGWRAANVPAPLYLGPAPRGWRTVIPLRGGICPLVAHAGAPAGRYGLYVSSAAVDDTDDRDVSEMIAQMKASGDPDMVQEATQAERELAAAAPPQMWMRSLGALREAMVQVALADCSGHP